MSLLSVAVLDLPYMKVCLDFWQNCLKPYTFRSQQQEHP